MPDFASMSHSQIASWWMENDPVKWERYLYELDPAAEAEVFDSFRESTRARLPAAGEPRG